MTSEPGRTTSSRARWEKGGVLAACARAPGSTTFTRFVIRGKAGTSGQSSAFGDRAFAPRGRSRGRGQVSQSSERRRHVIRPRAGLMRFVRLFEAKLPDLGANRYLRSELHELLTERSTRLPQSRTRRRHVHSLSQRQPTVMSGCWRPSWPYSLGQSPWGSETPANPLWLGGFETRAFGSPANQERTETDG
jgi:hypothetical protein